MYKIHNSFSRQSRKTCNSYAKAVGLESHNDSGLFSSYVRLAAKPSCIIVIKLQHDLYSLTNSYFYFLVLLRQITVAE